MEQKKVYGVWAVRSAASIFGRAESWCKEDGKLLEFDSKKDAEDYANEANSQVRDKTVLNYDKHLFRLAGFLARIFERLAETRF